MVRSVLDESKQLLEYPKAHILVEKCGTYKTLITERACRGRCRQYENLKESEMPSRQSKGVNHREPGVRADTCGVELGTGRWCLELHRGRCISWKEKLWFPGFLTARFRR